METLVVLIHHEEAGKGNEDNIEEMKENFISMKADLGIFNQKKKLEKKLTENNFKWMDVLN